MLRRITVMVLGVLLMAGTARAQRVETSFNVGYGGSEGIDTDPTLLLGQIYDKLSLDSGASFNFTAGVFLTQGAQVEFLYGHQSSQLNAEGSGVQLPLSDLSITNYMFNLNYSFGHSDAKLRPYVFGGIGATHYGFGNNLVPGSTVDIGGESRFATNWGGGIKYYFTPSVGVKAGFRWTPTYIKSDPAGVWCDPFYGCWALSDAQYSNQFETSAGVTIRF